MANTSLKSAVTDELVRQLLETPRGEMVSIEKLIDASPAISRTDDDLYTMQGHDGSLTRAELRALQEDVLNAVMRENLFINCWYEWEDSDCDDPDSGDSNSERYGPDSFSVHDMVEPGEHVDFSEISRFAVSAVMQGPGVNMVSFRDDLLYLGKVFDRRRSSRYIVNLRSKRQVALRNLISETGVLIGSDAMPAQRAARSRTAPGSVL